MILKCICKHKMQDKLHGKNMRVHTPMKGTTTVGGGWRCTVCLKEKK